MPGYVLRVEATADAELLAAGSGFVGLVASPVVLRWMLSVLFGVSARDPYTFVAVFTLLGIVALVACLIPALGARISLLQALRG